MTTKKRGRPPKRLPATYEEAIAEIMRIRARQAMRAKQWRKRKWLEAHPPRPGKAMQAIINLKRRAGIID